VSRSQRHTAVPLFDFSGGIVTAKSKTLLADNECEEILNGHLDAQGSVEQRNGYDPYIAGDTATTNPITGLYQFTTTGTDYVIRTQNALIQYNLAGVWTNITAALVVTTTANVRHVFETFRKNVMATNGTDIPWKWPGTGNATVIARAIGGGADTIDKAACLVRHRERTVMGDVTATETAVQTRYESAIWPSDAGTLDTWSASPTGKIHIDQGDGDSITCLLDALGYLVVFKQHSMHRVEFHGIAATQDRIRVAPVGTPGPHTAIVIESIVYFLDTEGRLWAYDVRQGDNPDGLVELTANKLGDMTLSNYVRSRLPYAHLLHDPNRNDLYCFLTQSGASATNVAWVYNLDARGFTRMDWDLNWNVSAQSRDSSENAVLLAGSTTGLVGQLDTGNDDNGVAFDFELVPGWKNAQAMDVVKGFRDVDIYTNLTGTGRTLDFEFRTDFATAGVLTTIILDDGGADTLT
jgi:hypothetical protein